MPINNRQDASDVDGFIDRIFTADTTDDRHDEIQRMFVEKLDFLRVPDSELGLNVTRAGVKLPAMAKVVARLQDTHVVYVDLAGTGIDTNRVRKLEAAEAARLIEGQLGGDLLLVLTNRDCDQLHFVLPSFERRQPSLRRMIVERDLPRRTAIEQLSNIYWEWEPTEDIRSALESAFDVEAVTEEFFTEYKRVFEGAKRKISGFENDDDTKHMFVQTLFNRLMFVYFVSRKGWLRFDGNNDYLNALWNSYASDHSHNNFYVDRLKQLFFAGLNNPSVRDLIGGNSALVNVIGDVPFLNGGLFEKSDLDDRDDVVVPDDAIQPILSQLFDRFNFTVMESMPLDVEVAVDPEMLGKVFEEMVNERHESGAYYTPRSVVSFMCREALKEYLAGRDIGLSDDTIARFVDERNTSGISLSEAHEVSRTLREITIIDPACGSGAYLLGMMQELVDLQTALYSDQLRSDSRSLHRLKLDIIERNLYGADCDDFGVNIAMLRLWLSLVIEQDDDHPQPLPNLDYKIVCGDSLLGSNPSSEDSADFYRHLTHQLDLRGKKADFMHATNGNQKRRLQLAIQQVEDEIRQIMGDAIQSDRVVDWAIDFADVFAFNEGFDVVVANPPYVSAIEFSRTRPKSMREAIKSRFESTKGAWDLFVPFYERALQLVGDTGVVAFITPNKILSAPYAKTLRSHLLQYGAITNVTDVSSIKIFPKASVNPVITTFRKDYDTESRINVTLPFRTSERFDPEDFLKHSLDQDVLNLLPDDIWGFLLSRNIDLLRRLLFGGVPLSDLGTVQATSTASESDEYGAFLDDNLQEESFKVVNTGLIDPYIFKWGEQPLRHDRTKYDSPRIPKRVVSANRGKLYRSPKIIYAKLAKRPEAALDSTGQYAALNVNCFHSPRADISLELILAFSNSSIFQFLYEQFFGALRMGPSYQFQAPQLRTIPFIVPNNSIRTEIEQAVRMILESEGEIRTLMDQIDDLLYQSYGLDDSEIRELEESITRQTRSVRRDG